MERAQDEGETAGAAEEAEFGGRDGPSASSGPAGMVVVRDVVVKDGERDHQFPVKAGQGDERTVDVPSGRNVTVILEIFAAERGCAVEELVLIREGEDEPLSGIVLIDADYPRNRRHHVHHVSAVKVTVFYQAGSHDHEFRRQATVDDVLAWVIKAFNIDPSMAPEFELARHGEKEELSGAEHIGHLAGRHCELALDLVRGDIANGSDT